VSARGSSLVLLLCVLTQPAGAQSYEWQIERATLYGERGKNFYITGMLSRYEGIRDEVARKLRWIRSRGESQLTEGHMVQSGAEWHFLPPFPVPDVQSLASMKPAERESDGLVLTLPSSIQVALVPIEEATGSAALIDSNVISANGAASR